MTQPPVFNWATSVGGTVVSGLTITAAEWIENQKDGDVLYGLNLCKCSGSPDLSGVLQSHRLDVSGMANPLNDGVHYIVSADNTGKTITVRMTARTDATANETGSSGSADVYDLGALLQAPSSQKQSQGYIPAEKPNAQQLNWMLNSFGQWTNYLATGDAGIIGAADLTALAAIDTTGFTGRAALVAGIGTYRWVSGSALTADGYTVIDSDVSGQWVLNAGQTLTFTHKQTGGGTWTHDLETLPGKIAKLTVDASDVSTNDVIVKVDGSTIDTLTPGQKDWYLVEPTTSVEVEAETITYSLADAAFDSGQSYSVSAQVLGSAEAVVFSPDRANMYVLDQNGASTAIHHYTLSTPGQLSSGVSYVSSLTIGGTYPNATGLWLKADGTRLYVFTNDTTGGLNRPVVQYNLGTPFSLSGATAGGATNLGGLVSWTGAATALHITDDGAKLLACDSGGGTDNIRQFSLGTPHDVSTGVTYDSVSLSVVTHAANLYGVFWSADKTKLFVVGRTDDNVAMYTTTGSTISGASYTAPKFSVNAQTGTPAGLWFSADGTKFYLCAGSTGRMIYRYSSGVDFAGSALVHLSYQL
jgi:hypothetical protein